jgi:hypothetical protein
LRGTDGGRTRVLDGVCVRDLLVGGTVSGFNKR